MALEETVNEIIMLVAEITKRDVDDVVRSDKWGEYNFDECRDDLESAYSVIRPLPELPLESILQAPAGSIQKQLGALNTAIKNTAEFSVKADNAAHERDALAAALIKHAQATWTAIAPWIGYLFFQAEDATEGLKKIRESQGHVDNALVSFLKKADDGQTQIENAVAAAKEVAGKAGVGHFTEDFANEAEAHNTAAFRWLVATVVFAVAAGSVAYHFGTAQQVPEEVAAILQYTTMRIVILGLLFTGTVWCGRMYKTNKHQQSINKHRANALQTFQAFVEATKDPAVRDAVLMETTRSIFTIAPSGYLGEIDKSPDAGSKIVEVIKAASKSATEDKG